jgi:arylsulfatase A-like enzyme
VILLDNLGFGATKPFGGVINMPTLEQLAKEGVTYTNFHTARLCSPSRVALLGERNPHSMNNGSLSELATAFPGQTAERPLNAAPLPEIMKLDGYSTAMFGKSHEFAPAEVGITGPFETWPTG